MIDATEKGRRHQCIRQGWREILPSDGVQEAIRLADTEFVKDPVFSVKRFVDRFVEVRPDQMMFKGMLFQKLLLSNTARLVSTETAEHNGNGTQTAPLTANGKVEMNGWSIVFNRLLAELTATFKLINAAALRSLQAYLLRNAKLTAIAKVQVQKWLDTSVPHFSRDVDQKEMHHILHHVYLWACIEMGPVDADKHLSRAVKAAETLPEAVVFRPQALL